DVLTSSNGTTDTFIFNVGDGADTISTYESSGVASDILRFGAGIISASISLERTGNDLIFKIGTNGDQVKVSNWYYGANYQLARLEFADGTVLTNAQISQRPVTQTGTAGNDNLYGSASNDVIDGLAGNDYISAGDGNNTVNGGLGDDNITTGAGNDTINGGDGNDTINGGGGTNTIRGGTGNDSVTSSNGATDTFVFNVGDGADTISTYESSGVPNDILQFGTGITAASVKLERSGYNLIFKIGTNGDQVAVSNWFNGANYQLARLQFADGTFLTNAQISQLSVNQTGTAGNDNLYGAASNDVIDGLAGNDYISAGDGNNTVNGGLGDDNITAGAGNDILVGGFGNDTLTGGIGADQFTFNATNQGIDTITDFLSSQGDKISVSASGFGGGLVAGATITAAQFVLGTAAADASDRFIYNVTNGSLLFDIDGTGAIAATQIAVLSSKPSIAHSDIFVIA
ncbi:MAG: calcium-binding protein, partial [Trichormus sp.]